MTRAMWILVVAVVVRVSVARGIRWGIWFQPRHALFGLLIAVALAGCQTWPIPIPEPPVVATTTTTTTTTTIPPVADDSTPNAPVLHGLVYTLEGCAIVQSRESGFVCNPNASSGHAKFILPGKYSGTVVKNGVCVFSADGSFHDDLHRKEPNEYPQGGGPRQRYEGNHAPGDYPKNLWIRWNCNVNGGAKDYAFCVPDPAARLGEYFAGERD